MNRRRHEADGAGIGCRFGDDKTIEGVLERLRVLDACNWLRAEPGRPLIVVQPRELETERSRAPPVFEREPVIEFVSIPAVTGTDKIGKGVVVAGRPSLCREEALEERLDRREVGEIDRRQCVACQMRHSRRRQTARGNVASALVACRLRNHRDVTIIANRDAPALRQSRKRNQARTAATQRSRQEVCPDPTVDTQQRTYPALGLCIPMIAALRASWVSFLSAHSLSNDRTRAESFAGTSTTVSPAATSRWANKLPSPSAPSIAHTLGT